MMIILLISLAITGWSAVVLLCIITAAVLATPITARRKK